MICQHGFEVKFHETLHVSVQGPSACETVQRLAVLVPPVSVRLSKGVAVLGSHSNEADQ